MDMLDSCSHHYQIPNIYLPRIYLMTIPFGTFVGHLALHRPFWALIAV